MADSKKTGDDYELDDRRPNGHFEAAPKPPPPTMQATSVSAMANNPMVSILCYCGSSILMTVANKYVVSGTNFNLNFFLLFIQVGPVVDFVWHEDRANEP